MAIQYLQSFIAGLLISLAGSLPFGNLNVAAMQIAVKENLPKALWFSAGVVVVEVTYLAVTVVIIGRFAIDEKVFFFFQVLSVIILLFMAIGSFMATRHKAGRHFVLNSTAKRFHLGVVMSAVNPMQVPFWTGWVVYLLSRSLIADTAAGFTLFALSAGLGTFIALLVFIFAGRKFSEIMQSKEKQVNIIIGYLFAAMAVFQFLKLWQH